MKLNKYLYRCVAMAAVVASLAACENDGDIIYTPGGNPPDVSTSSTNIVLNQNNLSALVLTLYWNDNGDISLSDPEVAAPEGAVNNTIEMATDENFENKYSEFVETGVFHRQYTCEELNNIVNGRLKMEGGVAAPLYVRISSSIGENIPPKYSNVLELTVTPFSVDMSKAEFLDKNMNPTGRYLYAAEGNGVYVGFIGAASWENWYMREGNNVLWGNDNVSWTAFVLGSGDMAGNMWYPEPAGCYYTVVNTGASEWSALLIESITLSGDINGEMEYELRNNRWLYTLNNASAGTYNVTISGQGKLYNVSTGTDNDAAVATQVAFTASANALQFKTGEAGTPVSFTVGESGEVLIALDLNNFNQCTIGTGEAAEPEPEPEVPDMPEGVEFGPNLYISGILNWDGFARYLKLYDADYYAYAGVQYADSEWGYKLYPEADNWDSFLTMNSGDAYEGTLRYSTDGGDSNIAAPEKGTYLMNVTISTMSYSLTKVEKISFTGISDDWDMYPMTADADDPMVFTAEVEKVADTPWGFQVLVNEEWGLKFGAYDGKLHPYEDGRASGNDVPNGSYILTVDFNNYTYKYTAK